MKNTLDNKAGLFAQYIVAEPVCQTSNSDGILSAATYHLNIKHGFEKRYLLLKSISSITDEDAIEVGFLLSKLSRGFIQMHDGYKKSLIESAKKYMKFEIEKSSVVDYLRSKGYALPYMGLSVEKQIEYGWIKLIE